MNKTFYTFFVLATAMLMNSPSVLANAETTNDASFSVNDTVYNGNSSSDDQINEYLGIPFAAPPIGELRWQPTQPYTPSESVIEVKQFAPACMQADRIVKWYKGVIEDFGGDPETFASPEFSEDCLYLNVLAPKTSNKDAEKLPVYIYMHGGSNKAGWSYEPNYIGRKMAERDMVVVSIPYRVGVFGFFPHADSEYVNFALLDQIAALQWVQDNIAAVGGDPARVTLAGESAGADNIAVLLGSPMAKGLFHRAVVQSGGWSIVSMPERKEVEHQIKALSIEVLGDENASLEQLRKIDAQELALAADIAFAELGFGPSVGDPVVPVSLREVAKARKLHNVDVILGSNTNEYLVYLSPDQTVQQWIDENPSDKETVAAIKAVLNDGSTELEQVDRLITAVQFGCPTLKLAEQINSNGSRAWVYDFNKVRTGELASKMGAYHGAEIPYIFNTHDDWLPTDAEDLQLTNEIAQYWSAFVAQGTPQTEELAQWPEFSEDQRLAISLGKNVQAVSHPSIELCRLLAIIE